MNTEHEVNQPVFGFSEPAIYQIMVLGKVPQSWSEKLLGMIITYHETDKKVITTLKGKVSDQSALSGVLNCLYDIHMSVLSVKKINKK